MAEYEKLYGEETEQEKMMKKMVEDRIRKRFEEEQSTGMNLEQREQAELKDAAPGVGTNIARVLASTFSGMAGKDAGIGDYAKQDASSRKSVTDKFAKIRSQQEKDNAYINDYRKLKAKEKLDEMTAKQAVLNINTKELDLLMKQKTADQQKEAMDPDSEFSQEYRKALEFSKNQGLKPGQKPFVASDKMSFAQAVLTYGKPGEVSKAYAQHLMNLEKAEIAQNGLNSAADKQHERAKELKQMDIEGKKDAAQTKADTTAAALEAKPTEVEKVTDREFAKNYEEYTKNKATDEINVSTFEDVIKKLEDKKLDTGWAEGVKTFFAKKVGVETDLMEAQSAVRGAVQSMLRPILGGQFAAEEGERVIQTSFDNKKSVEANIKSLKKELAKVMSRKAVFEDKARYVKENRTLRGWTPGGSSKAGKIITHNGKRYIVGTNGDDLTPVAE